MVFLNILDNEIFHMAAETLLIVTGSMLLGLLVGYFYYVRLRAELEESRQETTRVRHEADELRVRLQEAIARQRDIESSLDDARAKIDLQARRIHDQYVSLQGEEDRQARHQTELDGLQAQIDTYRARLQVIEAELAAARQDRSILDTQEVSGPASAIFESVREILGRAVEEDDLTIVTGIGPKIASVLHLHGVRTWQELSLTSVELLRQILESEGGIYRAADPTTWPEQAGMAARGEWRRLKAYQEHLRHQEKA